MANSDDFTTPTRDSANDKVNLENSTSTSLNTNNTAHLHIPFKHVHFPSALPDPQPSSPPLRSPPPPPSHSDHLHLPLKLVHFPSTLPDPQPSSTPLRSPPPPPSHSDHLHIPLKLVHFPSTLADPQPSSTPLRSPPPPSSNGCDVIRDEAGEEDFNASDSILMPVTPPSTPTLKTPGAETEENGENGSCKIDLERHPAFSHPNEIQKSLASTLQPLQLDSQNSS